MKISFEEPLGFIAHCTLAERFVPKDAGFWFDYSSTKKWFTRDFKTASALGHYFDESAKKKISSVTLEEKPWGGGLLSAIPPEKKFSRSQIEGFSFAKTRNFSYLAFDAGVGKTPLAVALMNADSSDQDILLIIPPFLISNWLDHIHRWRTREYSIYGILSNKGITKLNKNNGLKRILIIPDSMIINVQIPKIWNFGLAVVDEAHRFMNDEAKRTIALLGDHKNSGLIHQTKCRVFLSGSPVKKGAIHLFPILRSSAWNLINYAPKHAFGVQYCAGYKRQITASKWIWDYSGLSNVEELQEKVFDKFILRKKLKLKAKHFERIILMDAENGNKEIHSIEKRIFGDNSLEDIIGSNDLGAIAEYRKLMIDQILPPAIDYITDILNSSDESILILAIHQKTIEQLAEKLKKYKPMVIYGKTKRDERDRIQSQFSERKFRIIIASIPCMVGINLQIGTRNIFVESSWDYIDNYQASCRTYRRGQKKNVISDHLVIGYSIGEYMMRTVLRKKKNFKQLMNHKQRRKNATRR